MLEESSDYDDALQHPSDVRFNRPLPYSGTQIVEINKEQDSMKNVGERKDHSSFQNIHQNPINTTTTNDQVHARSDEVGQIGSLNPSMLPVRYHVTQGTQEQEFTIPAVRKISEIISGWSDEVPLYIFIFGSVSFFFINLLINPCVEFLTTMMYVVLLPSGLSPLTFVGYILCAAFSVIPLVAFGIGGMWIGHVEKKGRVYGVMNFVGFCVAIFAFLFYPIFGMIVYSGLYLFSVFGIVLYVSIFCIYCCVQVYCVY